MEICEKRLPKAMYNSGALFNPYQYEPLMKLFDSKTHEYNGNNILITDEVGVGKTIEAGIIIKEYLRLYPNARTIIICPAKLCKNWKEEMKKLFNESFKNFREDKDIEEEDVSIILPNSFFIRTDDVSKEQDEEVEKDEENNQENQKYIQEISKKIEKYNLQEYDLLIVDEAHSVRNKGKLFNGIKTLIENNTNKSENELRIFMTATPIVNKKEDYDAIQELLKIGTNMKLENTRTMQGQANCYDYQLDIQMKEFEFSDEEKEIIQYVYFNQFDNHNRGYMKRAMASSINTLYEYYTKEKEDREKVEKDENDDAKVSRSDDGNDNITLGDRLDLYIENGSENLIKEMYNKLTEEKNNQKIASDSSNNQTDDYLKTLLEAVKNNTDSKLAALIDLIINKIKPEEVKNSPFKVVIFTWSKITAKYLEEKLKDSDYLRKITKENDCFYFSKTAVINGDTINTVDILKEFQKTNKSMALICTEAAREGLNMQFCHNLIHYDFPFTPASICQRNGRIYRPRKEYDSINPRVWYMYSGYGYDVRQYDEIILSKLELVEELVEHELIVPMNILPEDEVKLKKALFRDFVNKFIDSFETNEENNVTKIKMKNIEKLNKFLNSKDINSQILESKIFESEKDFEYLNELIQAYLEKGVGIEKKKRGEESLENYKKQYCIQLQKFYEYIGGENTIGDTDSCDIDKKRENIFSMFSKYCDDIFASYSTKMKWRNTKNTIADINSENCWYSWQIYSTDGGRKLVRLSDNQPNEVTLKEFSQHHVMWKDELYGETRNE